MRTRVTTTGLQTETGCGVGVAVIVVFQLNHRRVTVEMREGLGGDTGLVAHNDDIQ